MIYWLAVLVILWPWAAFGVKSMFTLPGENDQWFIVIGVFNTGVALGLVTGYLIRPYL